MSSESETRSAIDLIAATIALYAGTVLSLALVADVLTMMMTITAAPRDAPQDDRAICVSAARWAFKRVAIIESDATGRPHTRWLVCGP
jgi:hypothetical protein